MIAITSGEEAFDDLNNNGVYDESPAEPFEDLTEPFVDNNDNGTWDAKERYVDANGNGKWDGKNGKFDATTLIWVQERILWTGMPHGEDLRSDSGFKSIIRSISPPPGMQHLTKFDALLAEFLVSDPWFNTLARNENNDGCESAAVGPVEVAKLTRGRAFTYPAALLMRYAIQDVRDPTQPDVPNYPVAIEWEVSADCLYTASPIDGHKAVVTAPRVYGDIFP
jgi:hypothetical protein